MHSRGDGISIVKKHPLADVDDDILFVILGKLELIDRIRAKTVCKKWLQEITKIPYNHQGQFPWLFNCESGGARLRDHSSKRSYVIESRQHLDCGRICASKFGWILMSRRRTQETNNDILIMFFVYCPFNSNSMNLPSIIISRDVSILKDYAYSSNPTLSDCVFFALFGTYSDPPRIEIRTCRIGDKEWRNFKIDLSIRYNSFYTECINGLLYVILVRANAADMEGDSVLNSHVGTFDPESQEWKLIKNEKGFLTSRAKNSHLFPVVYNNKELYVARKFDVWDFFKYDMEENQWVEQPSLGNRVLFIGRFGSSLLVDAVGKLSNMANHVFYFELFQSVCYPFSFSSRETNHNRKFYDTTNGKMSKFEDWKYHKAWIIPTIDVFQ